MSSILVFTRGRGGVYCRTVPTSYGHIVSFLYFFKVAVSKCHFFLEEIPLYRGNSVNECHNRD